MLYIITGLSYQLSSASTHSLPSRIDQLSDSENDFDIEEDDSSSALGNSSYYIEFFSTKICQNMFGGLGLLGFGVPCNRESINCLKVRMAAISRKMILYQL